MAVDLSEITSCKIYLKQERLVHSFLQIDLMNQNVSTKDVWYLVFSTFKCVPAKKVEKIQIWCCIAVATHRSKGASDLRDVAW